MADAKPRENFVKIFLSESELQAVRLAAAVVSARSMSKFCRDVIVEEALRITAPLDLSAAIKASKSGKRAVQTDQKVQRERRRDK